MGRTERSRRSTSSQEDALVLGPLARDADGLWGLGDDGERRGHRGSRVVFLPEGVEPRHRGVGENLVPWSRFMLMDQVGPKTDPNWRIGPRLTVTLRAPYEPWEAMFTRHRRRYLSAHMFLLDDLLRQTIEAGEAERLGDPDWLAVIVGRLAPQHRWWQRGLRSAVAQARASVDGREPRSSVG